MTSPASDRLGGDDEAEILRAPVQYVLDEEGSRSATIMVRLRFQRPANTLAITMSSMCSE